MRTRSVRGLALATALGAIGSVHAAGLGLVRFVIVDPVTHSPIAGTVTVTDPSGRVARLSADVLAAGRTASFDTVHWNAPLMALDTAKPTIIEIPLGTSVVLRQQDQTPVKEITIRVTATRLIPNTAPVATSGTSRTKDDLNKFIDTNNTDTRQLTKGQAGVAEDSAGQQHVRGEHTEITYVIDGVPLPDTLSGRAGSIVVPNTIQNLQIITGGFAPEFGGQTAAVLNIQTISSVSKPSTDLSFQGGSFNTFSEDLTSEGPIGNKANYVVDLSANKTGIVNEPQQPNDQSAHNSGSSQSIFTKFRYNPSSQDSLTMTLSDNPDASQIANRTGLPSSFAQSGEGYGFLGLRNADGTRPDVNGSNSNLLGAQKIVLGSQQQEGMDIDQTEQNQFAILDYVHKMGKNDTAQLAFTYLHGAQSLTNNNPLVDIGNLPVDNSIEYNPTANRDIEHIQLTGSLESKRSSHDFKEGFLGDIQSGTETYQIIPASQLALDELAAVDSLLAPPGTASKQLDIDGNPVFTATGQSPVVTVKRSGYYFAAYAQDTWNWGHFTADYGLRYDLYHQHESISTADVTLQTLSPRVNLEYKLDRLDDIRASYNRLFNTPPLAQGGLIGDPIIPETLSQYDIAVSRQMAKNQTATLAYYYKDIRDQVDVGLLVPGSEIGLFSGVNFQYGGVHGVEFSYDINAPHGVGWDEYLNFSFSAAKPNGLDNTGAPAPEFNDHDQRETLGLGLAYTWKNGMSMACTFQYNSGLASSVVPPSTDRTPRSQLDIHATTGDKMFRGRGGLELDISNLFDSREVINFQSGFSGTRFQEGRTVTFGVNLHF